MFESLERLILLQIGAAAATRERVEEVVNRLIEQGRMEREEGRTVVEDVLRRGRERSAGARSLIDASLQQGLRGVGVPNREAFEDLLFRIEQLEHRVRLLEDSPAAMPPAARPEPTAPAVGHPPPLDEVDAAPPHPSAESPRNDPDPPPSLPPRA